MKFVKRRGQILLEFLVSVAFFSAGIFTVSAFIFEALSSQGFIAERTRALALAEEALEAVRSIRDDTYNNLEEGTFGVALSDGRWALIGMSDSNGPFTRSVRIDLLPDGRADVVVNILWRSVQSRQETVSIFTRLARW